MWLYAYIIYTKRYTTTMSITSYEPCFFLLYPGYILSFCLRFAYAVAVSAYAGLLCLDLPTRAYAYHIIFDFAYAACIWCFCGVCVLSCLFMFAYASLRTPPKCLRRQHFTRHSSSKLKLPTKKHCSYHKMIVYI